LSMRLKHDWIDTNYMPHIKIEFTSIHKLGER
jgi:hypothetical protein